MAKETITSGAGVLWAAIVTMLNNMFTELYLSVVGRTQDAEEDLVRVFDITPATVGNEKFQIQMQSYPNLGAGAGTYNHATFFGWNASRHAGHVGAVTGKPCILMGFEDNYFDHAGDGQYATEWYVEGWSPDGNTVVMSRPFYCRGVQGDDGTDWWKVEFKLGTTGTRREFNVASSEGSLLTVTPTDIRVGVPFYRATFSDILALDSSSTLSISRQQEGNLTTGKALEAVITPRTGCFADAQVLYGVYATASKGASNATYTKAIGGYFSASGCWKNYGVIVESGFVGIGTTDPKTNLHVTGLPVYANNAAALAAGLTDGAFYRTGADPDLVCVVH